MAAEPLSTPPPDLTGAPRAKSSTRSLIEDLIVTAFGLATSAGVAYGSFYLSRNGGTAVYTWMANLVIPIGAILCGFVAAIGYWIGARLFNHRPSRLLLLNIVLVAVGTFFSIHHLDYTHASYNGMPLENLMSFPDYLSRVTEHMVYKDTHGTGEGTELGKWGWGVAALQVLGFSLGGILVYAGLANTPYCARCSMYFRKVWHLTSRWKDLALMSQAYEARAALLDGGHLQSAADQQATPGDAGRFRVHGLLGMDVRVCPGCAKHRLKLTAQKRNGNNFSTVAAKVVESATPIHKPTATPA